MVNWMTNRQIAQFRDGVFAVGAVLGLYFWKRYSKLWFLMRWCSSGIRRDFVKQVLTTFPHIGNTKSLNGLFRS